METFNIFQILLFVSIVSAAHIPEVYEDGQKYDKGDAFKQPVFNFQEYQKLIQQDPQKMRYQQQQIVDQKVIQRNGKQLNLMDKVDEMPAKMPPQSNWKIVHPKFVTENVKGDIKQNRPQPSKDAENKSEKSKITKKSLLPNSYEEPVNNNDRQDFGQNYIYVNGAEDPKVLQQNLGGFVIDNNHDNQLEALNSLLGQNPTAQLHGLQQLLNDKDHTPIKEDVVDIPNVQAKPNIKVEHSQGIQGVLHRAPNSPEALTDLQAQLDLTAKSHAESILAQAQQKAIEHVKAQHEALAKVQAEAEQRAREQIDAQNEALARAHAEAEAVRAAEEEKHEKEKEEKRKASERRRQLEQARERARVAAANYKLQQEQREKPKASKSDSHDPHTVVQKTRAHTQKKLRKVPKIQIHHEAKPSETQHHLTHIVPVAQIHVPQAHIPHHSTHEIQPHYQPFVQVHDPTLGQALTHLEHPTYTEAEVTKFYNPPKPILQDGHNLHGDAELEYAADYAFGYRIRNEGNDFGHKESKDGITTKGHYHVLLPDGRVQNVDYYVDDNGYHAKVSYDGIAQPIH